MDAHRSLPELVSSTLIDCHGAVTHTLTVLIDGRVRVRSGTVEVIVDPDARCVLTPGARLPAQVLDHACALAHEVRR